MPGTARDLFQSAHGFRGFGHPRAPRQMSSARSSGAANGGFPARRVVPRCQGVGNRGRAPARA